MSINSHLLFSFLTSNYFSIIALRRRRKVERKMRRSTLWATDDLTTPLKFRSDRNERRETVDDEEETEELKDESL